MQLRVDLFRLGLHPDVYERLKTIAGSRMTSAGELLITARRFRTQDANRTDARARLAEMIAAAHIAPRKRKATRPSRAAKAERVDKKKQRSAVKQTRGKVTDLATDVTTSRSTAADDKADACTATSLRALEGLVAGEPDADRQHGQCRRR